MYERVKAASDYIMKKCGTAKIGLILGSGLADAVSPANEISVNYADIPNFPISTTKTQKSIWSSGSLGGKQVYVMKGRFHFYEGYSGEDIAMPLRTMKLLGVKTVIVTNACGSINTNYRKGDIMLIKDHINLTGLNPLIGDNDDRFGPRFPDMTNAYDLSLREKAKRAADDLNIILREGVYIGFSGPSYETPAEIRAARILGADAVGMSTVADVIAANHAGLKVLGLSLIANPAAGITDNKLCHDDITETGHLYAERFSALIEHIIELI